MTNLDPPPPSPQPPDADRDWFGGRRWTGIAAIAVLVVVLLCVGILVIGGRGGHQPSAGSGAPTASAPQQAPSAPTSSPLPTPLPTAVPTTAPAGTHWTIFDTVALPYIPGQGPSHLNGAVATGYAHTPPGALLAAVNEMYRVLVADDSQNWRQAIDAMVAPGPGKDAVLRLRSSSPQGPAQSGDYSQVQGFVFVSYTPSDAVIQLATRDARGTLQTGPLHVTWSGGDWLWVPPASGVGTSQTTQSLQGFIEWSGV